MEWRRVEIVLDYLPIDKLLELIDEPNRSACKRIQTANRYRFEKARGSTHNHQTWEGGYIDHIVDGMNYIRHKYTFIHAFGRPVPFSLSDALLVFYLHDLEKPSRIVVDGEGKASNRQHLSTKEDFRRFREQEIAMYGITLNPMQYNAFTYIEGEGKDYSSERRVMNELAAFLHDPDTWSARGWYDHPLAEGDGWTGAQRFRSK